ncbi:UDP-glucose 4-epimerase family protein [Enterovibrio nigricans]|uniref:UDP-glucose 4-epimerase family protein n=1 Tax=Enterovibrio nigricans TaxID=504469 RepID=UPI00099A3E0F|nr:SDR family oxidoreductase [Enterovibrio nigricans]PKF49212.1 NAD-dependent dehydratase [Enterovibrio nigricans]
MKLLITGGSGFVGSRLIAVSKERHIDHRVQIRKQIGEDAHHIEVSDIGPDTDWSDALQGIDVVVHCAARVHQMKETESEALTAYRHTNTLGTLRLAQQASEAGVKRFVFLSSIKVNGEQTERGNPFVPAIDTLPIDPYGLSKYEAEIGLKQISEDTGMEVVIIRPPLVYGEGVKANFLSMMNLIRKGVPLPFVAINNKRSFVYRENLISLILLCCEHEKAAGNVFLVSDGQDVSTTTLFRQIGVNFGKENRLIPVPQSFLEWGARLLGKEALSQRLCGNLQLDISDTMSRLGWQPPYSFEQGIAKTVSTYKNALND